MKKMKPAPVRRPRDDAPPASWFWYWVNERHAIYLRRQAGESPPWSSDPIFQRVKFTNVSRRFDRLTMFIQKEVASRPPAEKLFRLAAFRVFNRVDTYRKLESLLRPGKWSLAEATKRLDAALANREAVCSPNWISIGGKLDEPGRDRPHRNLLGALDKLHRDRYALVPGASVTLEMTWHTYHTYPYIGPFLALELVSDLVEAKLLKYAPDRSTWTYLNNGAMRGLMTLDRIPVRINVKTKPRYPGGQLSSLNRLRALRDDQQKHRGVHVPELTALDVEHCLCEFAKYSRMRSGNDYLKNAFTPSQEPLP